MEDNFFKKFGQKTQQKTREDRLAKALRENLRKRKHQLRARVAHEPHQEAGDEPANDEPVIAVEEKTVASREEFQDQCEDGSNE